MKRLAVFFTAVMILFSASALAAETQVVDVAPGHTYVRAQVATNKDVSGKVTIASDARACSVGTIDTLEYGDAPFKATITISHRSGDNSGAYASIERTFYYQIAPQIQGQTCPARQGISVIVWPGSTIFVNVSLAHADKLGGIGIGRPRLIAFYHRPSY